MNDFPHIFEPLALRHRTLRARINLGAHTTNMGEGGLPFELPEEVPTALDRLVAELDERRAAIRVQPLGAVADRYLEVLRG